MPDRDAALRKYKAHADTYTNRFLLRTLESRRKNIARLGLRNRQIVMDVGCGTGLSFPILQGCIGPDGTIFGIEQSPKMLEQAERLVDQFAWSNVVLINAPVEEAIIPVEADTALFLRDARHYAHAARFGKCRSAPEAGGEGLAVGMMWAPWWALATNLRTWKMAREFCTTFEGMGRPWSHLETLVSDLTVERGIFHGFGVYIAVGHK